MSESLPERPDMRQLRSQAKELVVELHAHRSESVALATRFDEQLDPRRAKLADAQRIIARKYGFESWPKLVDEVETPKLIEKFISLVRSGNAAKLESLLKSSGAVRRRIDDPLFSFDSPAIVSVSGSANAGQLIPILVKYGANPNIRSKWWAGGFGALDSAKGATVDILLNLGAEFDVWSAAGHGRVEKLTELLDLDSSLVNAPGGDGERPLHFASSPEIVDLLVQRGADLEIRDLDHESTPVQYQISNLPVARRLVELGAKPDIFTAVALDDVDLLARVIAEEPDAVTANVGKPPFTTTSSEGGHIYIYRIGSGTTPSQLAAKLKSKKVLDALVSSTSLLTQLVAAAWLEDANQVDSILENNPGIVSDIEPEQINAVAIAAQEGRPETVKLLLKAGFDPASPGMDSGSALHVACWFGQLPVVKLLIDRVPLDLKDASHGSPPLGWALHGAQFCRNPRGDYPGVVELLIRSGADFNAYANSSGNSMLAQAGDREDVKAVLLAALSS